MISVRDLYAVARPPRCSSRRPLLVGIADPARRRHPARRLAAAVRHLAARTSAPAPRPRSPSPSAVVAYGPRLAARLPWRRAAVDRLGAPPWPGSSPSRSSTAGSGASPAGSPPRYEYLQVIDRFHDIPAALRDFTHHILLDSPDHWPAARRRPSAGRHPHLRPPRPDRTGRRRLGGRLVHRRRRDGGGRGPGHRTRAGRARRLARRAAPFLVLAPAAVWMGTSADGYFAAVAAWAVAFSRSRSTGSTGRGRTGFAAGLLFGLTVLPLVRPHALRRDRPRAVAAARRPAGVPVAAATCSPDSAVVPLAFTLAGLQLVGGVPACWSSATTRARAASARTATGCGPTSPARSSSWAPPPWRACRRGRVPRLRPAAHDPRRRAPHRTAAVRGPARAARRRPVRDEQGGDGTDLAAVRDVAARRPAPSSTRPRAWLAAQAALACSSTICC